MAKTSMALLQFYGTRPFTAAKQYTMHVPTIGVKGLFKKRGGMVKSGLYGVAMFQAGAKRAPNFRAPSGIMTRMTKTKFKVVTGPVMLGSRALRTSVQRIKTFKSFQGAARHLTRHVLGSGPVRVRAHVARGMHGKMIRVRTYSRKRSRRR